MWVPIHETYSSGRFSVREYLHHVKRVFGIPFRVTVALRNGDGR